MSPISSNVLTNYSASVRNVVTDSEDEFSSRPEPRARLFIASCQAQIAIMLNIIRQSPLFSVRRLVFCLVITVFVVATDVLFIHLKDIQTAVDFATEVTIYTLGFYGGFTITALFNQPSDNQS